MLKRFLPRIFVDKVIYNNNKPNDKLNFYDEVIMFYISTSSLLFSLQRQFLELRVILDKNNEDCMFTKTMLNSWNPIHFSTCGWYLNCPIK